MSWLRLCAVLGLLVSDAAFAADMPGMLPPPSAATFLPPLPASWGWYVRGDLGGYWGTMGGAQSAPGFPSPTDNSIDNGFVGGVGAGFKAGWVRSDVTVVFFVLFFSGLFVLPGVVLALVVV